MDRLPHAEPLGAPARSAPDGARSVEQHAALVADLVPTVGSETVALDDAAGRVLSSAVVAGDDLPAFDNSAMDGYALRLGELTAAGLPVAGTIFAGDPGDTPLPPGAACRIMTGAPVPVGADTVVPVESTDGGREIVRVTAPVRPGRHIRLRGEDVRRGATVLGAGTVLDAPRLAAAAAAGVSTVAVCARLRVGVLSAGSELAAVGHSRGPGQIHDTNGLMLATALRSDGCLVERLPVLADRPGEVADLLARHVDTFDLLVTSGGISAGDHEVIKDALGPRGVEFGPVALKPGGLHGAGRVGALAVICLPGNPVACWVGYELFVRPAVRAAAGLPTRQVRVRARCSVAVPMRGGRREYLPAVLDPDAGEVRPIVGAAPHSYRALAEADCLVELGEFVEPDGARRVQAGDIVTVLRTR